MAGRNVPESYNGLGYSNLIYITLQISIFCQLFEERTPRSLSHILFIEEPEAHLHPQMQMVFIRKIKEFIRQKEWNVPSCELRLTHLKYSQIVSLNVYVILK